MERIITGLMQRGPAVALLILAAVAAEVRFPCMSVFVKIPREKRRLISGRRMWRPL